MLAKRRYFGDKEIASMRRRTSPFQLPGSPVRPVKSRWPSRKVIYLVALLIILMVAASLLFTTSGTPRQSLLRILPVPHQLLTIQLLHNDKEISLDANSELVLNPRDTLRILHVQTDGWFQWGTRLAASGFAVENVRNQAVSMEKLLPQETFEVPRHLPLQAFWWDQLLGEVTLVVQLDARDWMQKALSATDLERKIGYLKNVLQENPGNVLAKSQLASLYLEAKKYALAAQLYEEIAEKGKSRELLEKLLLSYQQQGKVDQSLMIYLDLLDLTQDAEIFKQFLSYLQKHKGKQEAAEFLTKHQQAIPKGYQKNVVLVLADLYVQAKDWPKAAAAYEEAIRRGVKDPDIYYNLAIAYQQSKDLTRSARAMENYVQRNPKDLKTRMELAQLQEKQGATDQARVSYEAILKDDPNQEKALLHLVAILEKSNDKAALKTYYQKLAALQPKNKLVHFNLGVLCYEGKNWPEATKAFEAVAGLDGKDIDSRKYLLDLYRKQGNQKGELEMLQNLARLQPDKTSYYDEIFSGYDKKQDYRGMVDFFKEAAKNRSDSVQLHQYILYGLLKQGNKKGAVEELDILIRLQPQEKKHLRQAANLYEELGNYPEALKKVEQLLKLDPKNKTVEDDYLRLRMRVMGTKKAG
jgi:tetratricopeptide (TPR) repeat protein